VRSKGGEGLRGRRRRRGGGRKRRELSRLKQERFEEETGRMSKSISIR